MKSAVAASSTLERCIPVDITRKNTRDSAISIVTSSTPSPSNSHKRMEPDTSSDSSSVSSNVPKSSSTTQLNESDKRRRLLQDPSTSHMDAATGLPLNPQQSQLLRIVYEDLRKQATVGWHNAVNSFEIAHAHLHEPETQEFLQLCFAQVVNIMLDQMTSKMAVNEKNCVIRTLTKGTVLCLAQIQNPQSPPSCRLTYLSHMALILNKQKHFYKEFRGSSVSHHMMGQYWNKSPSGCPEVRMQCLALFNEGHGFSMLTQTLEQYVVDADKGVAFLQTVPMDDLKLLLQGLYDVRGQVDPMCIHRLLQAVLSLLLVLPAAELKKEPTDSIGHMLHLIQRFIELEKTKDDALALQDAVLDVIGRFIESTSLPQRLFGFEQLGSVVQLARRSTPLPVSYQVTGAGSDIVNGVYKLVIPATPSSTLPVPGTYIKQEINAVSSHRHHPSPVTPHPMTLFCCTMKNGSKMWFLSEADQAQPGTDQDIDYYHHPSAGDEIIPPLSHWVPTGQGIGPSPLLIPIRAAECIPADPTRLDQRVLAFVEEKKLLNEIFGDRMHREIVVRSASLLRFLAEAGQLTDDRLQHIWTSATGKEESLVTEIHTLVVTSMLVYLNDAQVASFLSFLLSQPASALSDVALFVDKLAATYRTVLHRVNTTVTVMCLRLIWRIQNSSDPQAKDACSTSEVVELFQTGLQSPSGEKERWLFVKECIDVLRVSAQTIGAQLSAEQEVATTRSLELLKVLFESSSDGSASGGIVDKVNSTYGLVQLLFDELAAFVQRQTIESALRHRLDLIHYIYGKSHALEMTQAQVRSLWTVLSKQGGSVYRDLCWLFLAESSVFAQDNVAPFNVAVCEYIFNDLICNPKETDFSALSESGFACFLMYFIGINAHHHYLIRSTTNNSIRRILSFEALIGLDALWEMAIYGLPNVSKSAIVELLNVYVQVDSTLADKATQHFLQHVFDVLKRSSSDVHVVQHCMHLLTGYMNQSPISAAVLHGKRSRGAPLTLECVVQRMPSSMLEKIPPFTLHVSSNNTLGSVRQLVEAQLRHPLTQTKLLVQGAPLIGDGKTLSEFPQFMQDSKPSVEVTIVLFQTYVTKDFTGADSASAGQPHHLGTLLSQCESYFDVLFGLLDRYQEKQDTETHAIVLDVIANLPTQTNLLDLVSQPLERSESLQKWLTYNTSYHKAVYVLEIIDGCLMPVHGQASPAYVASFIKYGLDQVVHFLFENRVNEHGMAVAIRLVKFCVLDASSSSSKSVHMSAGQVASLMTQLSALVLRTALSPRIVIDALQIMQAISVHMPFQLPDPWPMQSTLLHPEEQIRVQWFATLQTQPNVMQLITPALQALQHSLPIDSDRGTQLFALLKFLVPQMNPDHVEELEAALVGLFQPAMSNSVLLGSLTILQTMCVQPTLSARARQQILNVAYDKCLFASGTKCLCATPETRKAAYAVVAQLASIHATELHAKLSSLIETTKSTNASWGQEVNVIARGPDDHVGLKNQGCSCYMNSFLQQMFMYPPIRQGLLAAEIPLDRFPEIPESELNLQQLVQTNPTSLIGRRIMNEANNGRSFEAVITGYDPQTKFHLIKYDEGSTDVRLKLWGKEAMSRVTLLPPALQGDDATVEVLRQVQRTFWYLKESEMRYYNPKALVEACKCLNLEFSVYQQNDASEFCDKLLDRLEIGLGKTPQGAACLQSHLGGKLISQKLPKGCGHRFEREEAFIRLELQIRGKESIEESLSAFVEGELMDGDNKVECELCGEKKAAIRRTCFGALPQLLVLHLKRFDLDYATFETVKLNNRCSFPLELNMKPYTKHGLEEKSDDDNDDDNETKDVNMAEHADKDDAEYTYHLRGVLVHAGVAQGGHYYSFIKDQAVGKWFKYDDEDVTLFDPANIEAECFGGMQKRTSSWNGVSNTMEMEVFSNALMLFYEKVSVVPPPSLAFPPVVNAAINTNPIAQQVWAANDLFLRHSYVFDTAFDEFIKQIVTARSTDFKWLQLGMQFVLAIVLRYRDKKGFGRWLSLFHDGFVTCPEFATWLLQAPDLSMFFTECPDPNARQTVARLLSRAATAVAAFPNHDTALTQLSTRIADWCVPPLVDEYFTLVHNIATLSPVIRERLQRYQMVSRLIHVLLGARSYPRLVQAYGPAGETPLECQALFDAIGALLGLTRNSPEPLLAEQTRPTAQNPFPKIILSVRARSAFALLFEEYSVDGIMGVKELQKYFRVCGTTVATAKLTAKKIKAILAKWPRLDLDAWLEYYTELAATTSKQVLSDLKAHGFRENLQRPPAVQALEPAALLLQHLPPLCREAIVHEVFIEVALEEDAEAVAELLVRVSLGNAATSTLVIKSVLAALYHAELGWKGQPIVDAAVLILTQLLTFDEANAASLIELTIVQTTYSLLVAATDRVKVYSQYGTAPALFIYRYITILMDLHKVPSVGRWLQARVTDWVWTYEWLRVESLKPSLGGRVAVLYRDPGKLETLMALGELLHVPFTPDEKSYTVSDAGFAPVNGVYSMQQHQRHDGCPVFCMTSPINHVEYTLFRCEMPSKTHRWYISHADNRQTLGTMTDVDYYYCLCTVHDDTPPEDGWKVWSKNPDAVGPTPHITLHSCSVTADDLDVTGHGTHHLGGGTKFVVPEVDMDEEDQTVEYEDSEEEIRVSNERFQAVHLESPSEGSITGGGRL